MQSLIVSLVLILLAVSPVSSVLSASSYVPDSNSNWAQPLPGYVLQGQAPGDLHVIVNIAIPLRNVGLLSSMVEQVSDPSSHLFRQFLTRTQIQQEFLPTDAYNSMLAYLQSAGLQADRSLIQNINQEYHKQEVFDFFIKLAHRIGVLVIVEGIETEAEALSCLERGADLVQGYYFAYPQPPTQTCLESGLDYASRLRSILTEHLVQRFTQRKLMYKSYNDIASRITAVVEMSNPAECETMLEHALKRFPSAECAYVIHESGRQITRTVFSPSCNQRKRTALFGPAPAGGNQSAKDYFMYLGKNQRHYVTRPYVSVATGNVCVTISNRVSLASGESYVVCVDIHLGDEAPS